MRRTLLLPLLILGMSAVADDIRGPVVSEIAVQPGETSEAVSLGIDDIVLADVAGDPRFHDALEIELTVPGEAIEFPGALAYLILTTGSVSERAGVVDINGVSLAQAPLSRIGRISLIVPLRPEAEVTSGVGSIVLSVLPGPESRPIAVTLQSHMKGIPPDVANAEVQLLVRSVSRDIGAVHVSYRGEAGDFDPDGLRSPEFTIMLDGEPVQASGEYLLEPGIHRFELVSERYQDQYVSVGVERGQSTRITIPLEPALATVNYTAPRGALVWLDGQRLEAESGAFTAEPGQHTIVVTVGDYTVTRRFEVQEAREYEISVTMDIVIVETK